MTIKLDPVTHELVQWMALPAGATPDQKPRLSVFVSPRLYRVDGGWRWMLGTKTGFSDWPETLRNSLTFKAELEGLGLVRCDRFVPEETDPVSGAKHKPEPSSDIWKALFDAAFIVEPYAVPGSKAPSTQTTEVMSYSPSRIASFVQQRYKDRALGDQSQDFGRDAVASLSKMGQGEPFRRWSEVIGKYRTVRKHLGSEQKGDFTERDLRLAEFLLFHTAPEAPIFPRPKKKTDSPMISASGGQQAAGDEIIIDSKPDGQTFIADPLCEEGSVRTPHFLLPRLSSVEPGFKVIVRSVSTHESTASASGGDRFTDGATVRKFDRTTPDVVYRATSGGWMTEPEGLVDFHSAVSALTSYPALLRRLGLLFDVALNCTFKNLEDHPLIRIVPCRVRPAEIADVTPWTRSTVSEGGVTIFSPWSLDLSHGLLRSGSHEIVQTDDDSAMLKVAMNLDRNELPALRHAGIALVDDATSTNLNRALEQQVAHEKNFAGTVKKAVAQVSSAAEPAFAPPATNSMTGSDIIHGYRIDIKRTDAGDQKWRPLCERTVRYSGGFETFQAIDEGQIGRAADAVGDENATALRVSHTLFRWDGWSLVVPRPGHSLGGHGNVVEGDGEQEHPNLRAKMELDVGTDGLERLRFGGEYSFRARVVDVAGNGISLKDADTLFRAISSLDAEAAFKSPFYRFEPVHAPRLIPTHEQVSGETNERLVIRAFDDHHATPQVWIVAPPKVAQNLAEMCGAMDHLTPLESYAELLRLDHDVPAKPLSIGPGGRRDPFQYIADPYCRGIVLEGVVARFQQEGKPVNFDAGQFADLRIEVAAGDEAVKRIGNVIFVTVPLGRWRELRLSSMADDSDAKVFGLWHWLGRPSDKPQALANGKFDVVTPPRTIVVVHAVQRPLVPKDCKTIELRKIDVDRAFESTVADLKWSIHLDLPSSGRVDMQAEWNDMVDDAAQPDWTKAKGSARPFQEAVPPWKPRNQESVVVDFSDQHKFADTHHHEVTYRGAVTTRYADNFDKVEDKTRLTRLSTAVVKHIPNSAPPNVPEIDYIVPTFAMSEKRDSRSRIDRSRTSGFRVYLERGWFSSGNDEMLAVILPRSAFDVIDEETQKKVSEWGMDPIWSSEPLPPRPTLDSFEAPVKIVSMPLSYSKNAEGKLIAGPEVAVAAYPVALDVKKNKLFCDVDVRIPHSYFPFLRLALARYQPYSVCGAHLSGVRRAAFVQLLPSRTLSARRIGRDRYRIALTGPGYVPANPTDAPAGRTEFAWNLPYPDVKVGVERRTLHRTSLGWVPLPQLTRQLEGRRTSATTWLWEGEIDVPSDSETRLVVREYEHFPTEFVPLDKNGTKPPVPDRFRLTYIDAIELCKL